MPRVITMEKSKHKTLEQRLEEFYGKPIEEILMESQAERATGYTGRTSTEILSDMDQILEEGGTHMAAIEVDRDTLEQFKTVCEDQGRDAGFTAVLLIRWAAEHPEELDNILS